MHVTELSTISGPLECRKARGMQDLRKIIVVTRPIWAITVSKEPCLQELRVDPNWNLCLKI